jgi:uncharacterized protein (DUF849 family)
VAELVDAHDSKSCAARHGGSIPSTGTTKVLGVIDDRPHVQFVVGIKNALPAESRILDFLLSELRLDLPKATWTAAGIGRHQTEVIDWILNREGRR